MTMEANVSAGTEDDALFAELTSNEAASNEPSQMAEQQFTAPAETPKQEAVSAQPEIQQEAPRVPLAELKAEREKRQQYERELAEMRGRLQAMERFAAPQPMQQELPPPDIFQDPAAFVQAQVHQAIAPRDQASMYNARLIAEARFGEKDTAEAIESFDTLMAQGRIHPAEIQRVMQSPNPFAEAVKWHKQHKIVSEIGDPVSYREKVLAEAMNDPAFRQKAMDAWRQQASNAPQQAGQPAINLPPSLSRVGSAALPVARDGDDEEAIWNSMTAKRKR